MPLRELNPNEDLIRQGDRPNVSALVVSGMVARYHLLQDGRRQYISFHMAGDMPDSQALFIDQMDHAVCAIGPAIVASIPHKDMMATFDRRPSIAFAIWRETLIDAAIFREAVTNNSARTSVRADGSSVLRTVLSRSGLRIGQRKLLSGAHQSRAIG